MTLAEQIANYLYYLDLGIYSPGNADGNIHIDNLPEGEELIGIYNRGGEGADIKNGYLSVGIQIIYRGTHNPLTSFVIAKDIFLALYEFSDGPLIPGGNYIIDFFSLQGSPERIGINENGCYEYTMNFNVEYLK